MLRIYLTNLVKYNEGCLQGEWVTLPVSDRDLKRVFRRIGINNQYQETFITDYESNIDGLEIGEFSNIGTLNDIAAMLEDLDMCEREIVSALLSDGYKIEEALCKKDDCCIWYGCDNLTELAERMEPTSSSRCFLKYGANSFTSILSTPPAPFFRRTFVKALFRFSRAVIRSSISILLPVSVHFIHFVHPLPIDASSNPSVFRTYLFLDSPLFSVFCLLTWLR